MIKHSRIKLPALLITTLFLASCVNAQKKSALAARSPAVRQNSVQRVDMPNALNSDQKIRQELTGQTDTLGISEEALKKAPLSVRHFYAGKKAAAKKNYISAIKHYNTVIKKYPRSAQVKPALLAKAQVYKEMGLAEPAQLNMRMAQKTAVAKQVRVKKQVVKNQTNQQATSPVVK